MTARIISMTFVALALCCAPFASAQLTIPGAESAVVISITPANPRPGETVTLRALSSLYDLSNSDIVWRVDGAIVAEGAGEVETKITVGKIGTAINVQVSIFSEDVAASGSARIVPARIDLLWEADSYVPVFYKGRALPSVGTSIKVLAIPHLLRADGTSIPSNQITYTWRKNGTVLGSLSGRGKSSITTAAPFLFDSDTISVEAMAADKSVSATEFVRINTVEPRLRLYQNHPLFGRLQHQALLATTFIPEDEMTFEAIPYFANVKSLRDKSLSYDWEVNRTPVVIDPDAPQSITINANSSTGVALIELGVQHNSNLLFNAQGSWEVNFRGAGVGSGGSDPFRATQ